MFDRLFDKLLGHVHGVESTDIATLRMVGQPREYYLKSPEKGASLILQIGRVSQKSEVCLAEMTTDQTRFRNFDTWSDKKNNNLYVLIPEELNGALFPQVEEAKRQKSQVPMEQFGIVFQAMDVASTHMVADRNYLRVVPELGNLTNYIRHTGYFIAYLDDLNQSPTQPILENLSHIITRTEEVLEKHSKLYAMDQNNVTKIVQYLDIFKAWGKKYGMEQPEIIPKKALQPAPASPPESVPRTTTQAAAPHDELADQVRKAAASANRATKVALRTTWQKAAEGARATRAVLKKMTAREEPPKKHAPESSKKRRSARHPVQAEFTPILPPETAWRPGSPRIAEQEHVQADLHKIFKNTDETLDLNQTPARLTLEGYLQPHQRTKFHMAILTSALAKCSMSDPYKIPHEVAEQLNAIYRMSDRPDIVDVHGQINQERLIVMAREHMQLGSGPIIDLVTIVSKNDILLPKLDQKAFDQIEGIRKQISAVEESLNDLRGHVEASTPGEKMVENIRNLFTPDQIMSIFGSSQNLNEMLDDWGSLSPAEQSTLINIAKKLDENRDPKVLKEYFTGLTYGVAFGQADRQLSTQKSGIVSFFTVADHPGKIAGYAKGEAMISDKEKYTLAIIPVMTELAEAFPEFKAFLPILREKLQGEGNFYQAFIEAKNDYTHKNQNRIGWERMTHIAHSGLFLQTLAVRSRNFAYQNDITNPDGVKRILADGVYPAPVYGAYMGGGKDVRTLTRYDLTAQERLIDQLLGGKGALVGANGSGKSVRVATELAIYLGIPVLVAENDASAVKVNCGKPDIATNMMAEQEKPWSTGQSTVMRLVDAMRARVVVSDEAGSGLPHNAQLTCNVLLALHTNGRQILHDGPSFARAVMAISQDIYDRMDIQAMTDNYQMREGLVESSEAVGVAIACIPSVQYQEDLQAKYRKIFGTDIRGFNVYLQIAEFLEKAEKIERGKKGIEFQSPDNLKAAGLSDREPDGKASHMSVRVNGMMAESVGRGPFGHSALLLAKNRQADLIGFMADTKITPDKARARGKIISACMTKKDADLVAYQITALAYDTVTADYAHAAALITDLTDNTPKALSEFISAMEYSGYFSPETLARYKALPSLLDKAAKIGSTRVRERVDYQTPDLGHLVPQIT